MYIRCDVEGRGPSTFEADVEGLNSNSIFDRFALRIVLSNILPNCSKTYISFQNGDHSLMYHFRTINQNENFRLDVFCLNFRDYKERIIIYIIFSRANILICAVTIIAFWRLGHPAFAGCLTIRISLREFQTKPFIFYSFRSTYLGISRLFLFLIQFNIFSNPFHGSNSPLVYHQIHEPEL